jgi:hypothetical protein
MTTFKIVFTDGRQQRQPIHNTTKYCVNRRKTTTTIESYHDHILCSLTEDNDNPIITQPHIVYNMWLYYDLVVVVLRQ